MQRREFLRLSAMASSLAVGATLVGTRIAQAAQLDTWPAAAFAAESLEAALQATVAKDQLPPSPKLRLRVPTTVEDPLSVPVSVAVDHPMHSDDYIEALYVFVDHNPTPLAAIFHCSPANGRAACYLRVKVFQDSAVRVVARSNRGQLFASAPAPVRVGLPLAPLLKKSTEKKP